MFRIQPRGATVFVLLGVLLVPLSLPAHAETGPEPIRRVLPNGMTVVLLENRAAPVVSIQVWVRTGSVEETEAEAGMTHVLEHMLFKGTERRGVGEIAREVEASGGQINAYTSWQRTVYYVTMASRFMDAGIDILADIIENAALDPVELAREKPVILEEIRRSKDMPARRLSEAFFREAYRVHPYGRPIIGFADRVEAFTREDLVRFYRKWYVPSNMVWVMVGDFDAERLLPRLAERLSAIPDRSAPAHAEVVEPPQTETRALILEQDAAEAHLRVGFHIPGIAHPDVPALDLVAQVLGEGRSSRLYQTFRMKQRLVNSVFAYSLTPRDPGLFMVGASLQPEDLPAALSGILEETLRMGFEPVSEDELARARVQIEKEFIYERETVQGQARELGYYQTVLGDLDFGNQYLRRLRAVRPQDLLRVARHYLRPGNMTVAVLAPPDAEGAPGEARILREAARAYARLADRYEEQASRQADGEQLAVHETRLSNGATLLVKPNPAVPLVSLRAVFLGGLLSETPETNGVSSFTARMLTKGTATRSAEQIAEQIESLAGSLSGFSGRDSIGLSGEVVSWNFEEALAIFSEVLLAPTFPEDHLEKTRRDILAEIESMEDRLIHLAFQEFWQELYPCRPYGMDLLGTPETIEAMRRDDLAAYYRRTAVGSNLVLSVVGDVDPRAVEALVEERLADLPRGDFRLSEATCEREAGRKVVREVSPEKLQAHVVIGARGARFEDKDRYSLEVLQAVLSGQGGRLFTDLRDRQSLAYTVSAINRPAYDPGAFGVYIATKPENLAQAVREIREQLQRVREEKVSDEELDRAKNYLIGTYAIDLQTNSALATTLAASERYGLGYDAYREYPKRIESVSARQVRKAARKYLAPDRLVEAQVIPGPGVGVAGSTLEGKPGTGESDGREG